MNKYALFLGCTTPTKVPQYELASTVSGEEPVEERRSGASNMQMARGARGESYPDLIRHGAHLPPF